ncbi:sensor histidine kinase [Hymenobacter bucti]|uniref:histidine kinase n=1 Tax=Hymenobacter bucti TaxID=1844114 RepID=A0ABW4QNN5_9BACT
MASPWPADVDAFGELAHALLDVTPTGLLLLRPVYDAAGEAIVDVAYEYLNEKAQLLLRLPAQPTESFLTIYPAETDLFAFFRTAFLAVEARSLYSGTYQRAGTAFHFHLVARRQAGRLVVSMTGAADQPHAAIKAALRASQARERAAWQLAERQQQDINRFFEQAPVAISLLRGPRHVVELINEASAALLGSTREKLLGQPMMEALPALQRQGFDRVLERVLQGETIVLDETPVVLDRAHLGQANHGYYYVRYQPWRAEGEEIIGAMIVAIEVTDQVLAHRQLEQLNQELEARVQERTRQALAAQAEAEHQRTRLAQLIAEAPAAICVLSGPDFVYELVNPRYQALFAGRIKVGQPILTAVPEFAGQPVWYGLKGVYETGRTHTAESKPVPVARPDGVVEERYFNYIEQARRNEHGEIDGVFVFGYEVTDQVRARQQVQRLNQELTTANQDLGAANQQLTRTNVDLDNFIYTASHDLKAPITNIEGLLYLLKKALPAATRADELVANVLARMHSSVERFTRTIGHLTDVTKLQTEFAQPPATLLLAAVVEDVRQDLLPRFTEAGAHLEVAVDECQPRVFSEKNLHSVVYNLLSNALKYRHPDRPPRIRVACATEGNSLVLTVQDNGLGVSEWQQARLFQLFQRLHTHVEGSGLGLYMVKKIVENAGGTINVESQVNVGSTFTIRFPA